MKGLGTKKLIAIWLLLPVICQADLGDDLDEWFETMNYSGTDPGVYEAQSANYISGGGFSYRAPITQVGQIFNAQTPRINAGCGGIDLYAGGFSAINSDAFVESLRNIGQNAQSLFFMLAIRVVSPMLEGSMEYINDIGNKFNKFSMDSCQAATEILGGAADFAGATHGSCTIRRMNDYGEDWTTAQEGCKMKDVRHQTEAAGESPSDIDFTKGNLAWYVLMQDSYFRSNKELAELVMNLTGTLIYSETANGEVAPEVLLAAVYKGVIKERFKNIYNALLLGADTPDPLQMYRCEGDVTTDPMSCMRVSEEPETVTPNWEGIRTSINAKMNSIVGKIRQDGRTNSQVLDDAEKQLINETALPIYRYLTLIAAYYPKTFDLSGKADTYSALVAEDILVRGLSAIIERMEQNAANLPGGKSEGNRVKVFREQLALVLGGLGDLQREKRVTLETYERVLREMQLYEKGVMSKLNSGLLASVMWSR